MSDGTNSYVTKTLHPLRFADEAIEGDPHLVRRRIRAIRRRLQ
ncbi:MAG TPA: hypothetical protein VFF40_11340 [Acidimicrobiia bacterium]|nr:hypothetical protein [Acidimicrobiia bacterium]